MYKIGIIGNGFVGSSVAHGFSAQTGCDVDDIKKWQERQVFNEKLCAVRKVFDNYNLISALHSFMSFEDKKYIC